uniref:F-box domain-containing protein n=1 Tax=Mycena chlorophos TaxID=658473 RepID=A0ABQ0LSU6_MYCCL|nr:predicted protein [Mycena chlorophos]
MASSAAQLRVLIADLSLYVDLQQRALDESRARLAELQEKLQPLPYPHILRFPLEITAEIFLHFALDGVSNVLEANHNGPLLLTWVCAEWRRIALSTPILWSVFAVKTGLKTSTSGLLDLSRIWAERAMACRRRCLRIEHFENYRPESFRYLLDLVREASETVVSLDLKFYSEREYLRRLDELKPSFPQLEDLTLKLEDEDNGQFPEAPIDTFRDCPRLRRLHVDRIPVSLVVPSEHGRITQLEAYNLATADSLEALALLPNLVHCTFWGDLLDEYLALDDDAVSHDKITTFVLTMFDVQEHSDEDEEDAPGPLLLDLLTFPSLETLEAELPADSLEPSLRQLQAFMKGSSARLQTLIVEQFTNTPRHWHRHPVGLVTHDLLFRDLLFYPGQLTSLTKLRITSASMDLVQSSLYISNLQTVEFFHCDPYLVRQTVEEVAKVVKERRAYALRLRLEAAMKALELSILRILKIRLPGSIKSRLVEAITTSLETSPLISLRSVRLEFPDLFGYSCEPSDRYPQGVPETIRSLKKAGISVYVGTAKSSMLLEEN